MDPIYTLDPKKTYTIPAKLCYACDKDAIGVTTHNGKIKAGCKRHAQPSIRAEFSVPKLVKVVPLRCMYCDEPVRAGSLDFGDNVAHKRCYKQDLLNVPFDKWK